MAAAIKGHFSAQILTALNYTVLCCPDNALALEADRRAVASQSAAAGEKEYTEHEI